MKKTMPQELFTPLLHPYQSTVITTISKEGKANAIAIAWIIPVSIKPPALAFAIRKSRYSFKLLNEVPEFVVNIPTSSFSKEVMFFGSVSGSERDKFKETQLDIEKAKSVTPPVIKDFPAHIECKVKRIVDIGCDHVLVIGDVIEAYADEKLFSKRWKVEEVELLLHLGGNEFTTNSKVRIKEHVSV